MTIFTGTYIPYDFNKRGCLKYIIDRCHNMKQTLKFVEMDNEHLTVRCPLSGDYLDILGTPEELTWINSELRRLNWYRLT